MKVLMVEHFLPGSVYTLELCRALHRGTDHDFLPQRRAPATGRCAVEG